LIRELETYLPRGSIFSAALIAAFAFSDNFAVLASLSGIRGVRLSRDAPGSLGSGNLPGFASPQPDAKSVIAAKNGKAMRCCFKFDLLYGYETHGREPDDNTGIRPCPVAPSDDSNHGADDAKKAPEPTEKKYQDNNESDHANSQLPGKTFPTARIRPLYRWPKGNFRTTTYIVAYHKGALK
jgi:hypothetical protein